MAIAIMPFGNAGTEAPCRPSGARKAAGKGQARYYTLFVDGDANPDSVWYYPEPSEAAAEIKDRVAFWKGVKIED